MRHRLPARRVCPAERLGGLFSSLVLHRSVQEAHLAVDDVDLAAEGAGFPTHAPNRGSLIPALNDDGSSSGSGGAQNLAGHEERIEKLSIVLCRDFHPSLRVRGPRRRVDQRAEFVDVARHPTRCQHQQVTDDVGSGVDETMDDPARHEHARATARFEVLRPDAQREVALEDVPHLISVVRRMKSRSACPKAATPPP